MAAVGAVEIALWPGVIPHAGWVAPVVGGLLAAQMWAMASAARRGWRSARSPSVVPGRVGALGWLLFTGVAALAFAAAWDGDVRLARRVGMTPPGLLGQLAGAAGAGVVAAVLILMARMVPSTMRAVGSLLGHPNAGRRVRELRLGTGALALLAVLATLVAPSASEALSSSAGSPTVGVSTDPQSWSGAGFEGRRFLSGIAPLPEASPPGTASSPRPSLRRAPLRVYARLATAPRVDDRARRAVDALEAVGGFERSVVLVAIPTGSGWVNQAAPAALERLLQGDVATVAVQYADSPSWLAYLWGREGARASVAAVLAAVETRIRDRAPARHPRLLIWGESLGAWAGLSATAANDRTVAGMLWAGAPASSPRPSPAVAARTVLLTHPDDPVGTWQPSLLLRPQHARTWLPVITFWRSTEDLVSAATVPPGHGHRYTTEYTNAWKHVLETGGFRPSTSPDATPALPIRRHSDRR